MIIKSQMFCDYCEAEITPTTAKTLKVGVITPLSEPSNPLSIDICHDCAVEKLEIILSVYKLEDSFMQDVLGIFEPELGSTSTRTRFAPEAVKSHTWSLVTSRVCPPRFNEMFDFQTNAAFPVPASTDIPLEDETKLLEEIEILRERIERQEDEINELRLSIQDMGLNIEKRIANQLLEALSRKD